MSLFLVAAIPYHVFAVKSPLNQSGSVADYRMQVLNMGEQGIESLPDLKKAVTHEHVLVRRAAVRSLHRVGDPAREILHKVTFEDEDPLVRRTALRLIADFIEGEEWVELLANAYRDENELVRQAVVEELAAIDIRDGVVLELLRQAQQDASSEVSRSATSALWPYRAEVKSARFRPEYQDLHLNVVERTALPEQGWLFQTDPAQTGHVNGWQTRDFEPNGWNDVAIGISWQKQGFTYEGVGWYRLLLELPEKPDYDIADLVFEGVDQSAWVWVNGQYVGAHDIGPVGWDKSFAADVGDILEWGKVNQISVRVLKPAGGHAGIWKPVYLELLKR